MKIARLKKQTKLVTPFVGMIKKSQLKIVLTLKAKTINCCTIVLYQVLDVRCAGGKCKLKIINCISKHIRTIVYLHAYSISYNIRSSVALHY